MPVGAMISRSDMTNFSLGEHTTTFGGNPLTSSAINASIEYILQENIIDNAEKTGQIFLNGLEELKSKYDSIRDVRGLGLMIAIESKFPIKDILFDGLNNGLIMLYSGRTILRFLPSLTLNESQVASSLQILDKLFQNSQKKVK